MTRCAYCKSKTEFHEGGVPICPECSEARTRRKPPRAAPEIQAALIEHVVDATTRLGAANWEFNEVMSQFRTGLPHSDGVQRIKNASHKLGTARKEMMRAHTRLNEFIERGIVPEDLKQGSGS